MATTLKHIAENGEIEHRLVDKDGNTRSLSDHDDWLRKYRLLNDRYPYVHYRDFYRYIFPEGSLERLGHQEDRKPNGLITKLETKEDGNTIGRRLILTDGLEQLTDDLMRSTVICAPISYYGRSAKADNALYMHALTLDIDYVGLKELEHIVYWFEGVDVIPRPTFITNSGHGVHLYYVFEDPLPLFKENQKAITKLKQALIKIIWTDYTSYDVTAIQALGCVQGFRMVGSRSKLNMYAVSAFKTGDRVTIDYLNGYVPKENRAVISPKNRMTAKEAKEAYPDWYQRIVVEKQKPKRWHVKRDLYDWYKRRIETEASYGHRYFCMMCLAIYARKCDISREELEEDANHFQKVFNALKPDQPFTIEEAFKALDAYNEDYITFPRDSVARVTALDIPANKRNGRRLDTHIEMVNEIRRMRRDVLGEDEYRNNGRPKGSTKEETPKGEQIKAYAKAHPDANHSQIARALGVSRPTVIKWLKKQSAVQSAVQFDVQGAVHEKS